METKKHLAPKISVVIPNHNGGAALQRCLTAVRASSYDNYECIVVDDGSTDRSVETMRDLAVQVIELGGGPFGPAHARNVGAQAASGAILFFLDADVVIYPDTLYKVVNAFTRNFELTAVFGSYDDQPGDGHFLSQYKNLFHHFVHQQANEASRSFWSGCGAIRRDAFLAVGGFDSVKFPKPSIEDIELGRRLSMQGHKIIIDKTIQVKHLKRWTLTNLIKTDIFSRGIPWTQLILADRAIPDDLNLETSQRWSALLAGGLLLLLTVSAFFFRQMVLLPILFSLFWFMLQGWQWDEETPRYEIDRRTILSFGIAVALFVILAVGLGFANFLPSALVLMGLIIVAPALTKGSPILRRATFALMIIFIGVIMLQIVAVYPLWLGAVACSSLGLFILLNRKFYMFFTKKRGLMFAAAVVPFHMLYFLYSVIAFLAGTFKYYWRSGSPVMIEPTRSKS